MNALRSSAACLAIAAVCLVVASQLPLAAEPGFLHIEAIKGEARREGYKDWIDIQSIVFGVARATDRSLGTPTGYPDFSDITITKQIDRTSPLLFESAVTGSAIPEVVIDFHKTTQHGTPWFLQVTLSDALVTAYETRATNDTTHEIISFHVGRIELEVRQNQGGTVRAFYDLSTHTGGELPGEPPPTNTPPSISALPDQSVEVNGTIDVSFQISDVNTPPEFLNVTPHSSNQALVPVENIVLSGSGSNRTATITPAPATAGSSVITFTVSDGDMSSSSNFTLAVTTATSVLLGPVQDVVTGAGETVTVPFLVGHVSADPSSLTVTATANDDNLIPSENIVVSGSGVQRAVAITPAIGQTGSTAITLTISDGSESVSATFQLTVEATSPPPAITAPAVIKAIAGQPVRLRGINLADPSAASHLILLQLTVPSGILSIDTAIPGGVTPEQIVGNDSPNISITAPLSAINATLGAPTGVSFTNVEAGSFELNLQASRSGSANTTITLEIYHTGFALWRSDQFSAIDLANPELEATLWGNLATPAGDGIPNIVKYALGLPPLEAHTPADLQALTIATDGERRYLTLTIQLRTGDPALLCFPELSPDLREWISGPEVFEEFASTPIDDPFQQVVYRREIDDDLPSAFVRLQINYDTE